jgi:hypothetical protein
MRMAPISTRVADREPNIGYVRTCPSLAKEQLGGAGACSMAAEEVPNDFPAFFARNPKITHVFFNGGKAETAFRCHNLANAE